MFRDPLAVLAMGSLMFAAPSAVFMLFGLWMEGK